MTVLDLAKRWAEPPRILVVADDVNSVRALCDSLLKFDCDVKVATTQTDALNAVFSTKYDLVFVDLSLPDGSGVDVVKAVKAEKPATPVLVVLGAERRCLEEATHCGAVTMLRKPFDLTPQHLWEALAMFKLRVANQAQSLATATV